MALFALAGFHQRAGYLEEACRLLREAIEYADNLRTRDWADAHVDESRAMLRNRLYDWGCEEADGRQNDDPDA